MKQVMRYISRCFRGHTDSHFGASGVGSSDAHFEVEEVDRNVAQRQSNTHVGLVLVLN